MMGKSGNAYRKMPANIRGHSLCISRGQSRYADYRNRGSGRLPARHRAARICIADGFRSRKYRLTSCHLQSSNKKLFNTEYGGFFHQRVGHGSWSEEAWAGFSTKENFTCFCVLLENKWQTFCGEVVRFVSNLEVQVWSG